MPIFVASVVFSSIGVVADDLTTRKFTREIGIEYESSVLFRLVQAKWGFKLWILIEASMITFFGFLDSYLLDMVIPGALLFCVFWGSYRGLLAASNLHVIAMYKAIGIEAFKEHGAWLNQQLSKAALNDRRKMKLHYYVCFFACLIAYSLMLILPFMPSSHAVSFLAFLSAGLILAVAVFLLKVASTT